MSTTISESVSSSPIAKVATPKGINTSEVDRQDKSALFSQDDKPTRQTSTAPDNHSSVVSSNSPMEYDKRFVFI
jgi:hypothetical protein